MKNTGLMLMLSSSLLVAGNAMAEKEQSPWSSNAELGLIFTSGNTETQNTSIKVDVTYEEEKWKHNGHAEAYGATTEDSDGQSSVSAERYELSGKSDYKFDESDYFFGLVKLQKDRFSGFEYENTVAAGYGHKAIKATDMELDLEVGPGIRFFKIDDESSDSETLIRLAGKYWLAVSDTSKFTQEVTVDVGEDITSTKSVTGLQANISGALAMKLTYTIKNKSDVPTGTEKTDTEAAVTLVYSF